MGMAKGVIAALAAAAIGTTERPARGRVGIASFGYLSASDLNGEPGSTPPLVRRARRAARRAKMRLRKRRGYVR
jgi:hypothetical protein